MFYLRALRHWRWLKAQILDGWEELAARSRYMEHLEWVVLVISTLNRELNQLLTHFGAADEAGEATDVCGGVNSSSRLQTSASMESHPPPQHPPHWPLLVLMFVFTSTCRSLLRAFKVKTSVLVVSPPS